MTVEEFINKLNEESLYEIKDFEFTIIQKIFGKYYHSEIKDVNIDMLQREITIKVEDYDG